jgi:hypothetical protein
MRTDGRAPAFGRTPPESASGPWDSHPDRRGPRCHRRHHRAGHTGRTGTLGVAAGGGSSAAVPHLGRNGWQRPQMPNAWCREPCELHGRGAARVWANGPSVTKLRRWTAKALTSPSGHEARPAVMWSARRRRSVSAALSPSAVRVSSVARPSAGSGSRRTSPAASSREARRVTPERLSPTSGARSAALQRGPGSRQAAEDRIGQLVHGLVRSRRACDFGVVLISGDQIR